MNEIQEYLRSLGYSEKNPFGHKMPDIIQMVRNCKDADDQGLFYDYEFVKLKSMITIYDRELKLKNLVD